MATNDIGRVTPIWRGFYSAAATYELNDIVIDTAGSVWWHKSEELTTGVVPAAGEIWDAVIDMSEFSGLIQAAITTAQTALAAAQEAVAEVTADTVRAETAAQNAEASALSASESAAGVGALAQAAEQAKNAAQTAASQAAASASSAGTSAASAGSSAQAAEASKTAAQTAASQAAGSAETASGAAAVVEQKKAEAIAAIEAKGEEVLESIPEDYTELSGEVDALKESINDAPQINETDETYTDLDLADSQGYVLARFFDGHIQTKKFNSANVKPGFEYKFSGSDLLLRYGYNDIYDAVIVLNRGRANNLFDFSALKLIPVGADLNEYETADLTQVWTSSTDMHGPFQFLAVNDADGIHADATSPSFTGGNHTLDNLGSGYETASSKYVKYFADGKPVDSGMGRASYFEIKWANDVQAYNTVKADGTGRACLTEYHDMIFDGVQFCEKVMLVPSEEIKMQLWYGFQFMSWGTTYTNIRFIDGTNRQKFAYGDSGIVSGNELTSGMIAWGQDHTIEMTVDTNIDLGKRELYTGSDGAKISASKGYFFIIGAPMHTMAADSAYCLHGSFRFCPTVIS